LPVGYLASAGRAAGFQFRLKVERDGWRCRSPVAGLSLVGNLESPGVGRFPTTVGPGWPMLRNTRGPFGCALCETSKTL
jgi:hypothetical protein